MEHPLIAIRAFIDRYDRADLDGSPTAKVLARLVAASEFQRLFVVLLHASVYSEGFGQRFVEIGAVDAIAPCRMLRGSMNLTLRRFFALLAQLLGAVDRNAATAWARFADLVAIDADLAETTFLHFVTTRIGDPTARSFYERLAISLEERDPHAIYPTSNYRESDGHVVVSADDRTVDAVMTLRTFSSLRMADRTLDLSSPILRDLYKSLGRCVCFVDENVERRYGAAIDRYFAHHGIALHKRVYRALESDKDIRTVETMLGDFKALGVSRNEPVLLVGGGVLADTGGLACALYGRNTPYVMLSTSIVAGIDAGPSPRTCCDGFGYKNLFGAYHPPVVSITDRYFFSTLAPSHLRHGIAEIIKMGVVRDAALFGDLEAAQDRLIETKFGTTDCTPGETITTLAGRILAAALRSYVAVEYGNLYETHQCRPHAYGHTWSPGFEIEAGLLHGHAVAICMGFGAYLSYRRRWIDEGTMHRILRLVSGYGLGLWDDVLANEELMWKSQETVTQKRGGNLVAPVPKGEIGQCGYLNDLPKDHLRAALDEYRSLCARYPRAGYGIDAMSDVLQPT